MTDQSSQDACEDKYLDEIMSALLKQHKGDYEAAWYALLDRAEFTCESLRRPLEPLVGKVFIDVVVDRDEGRVVSVNVAHESFEWVTGDTEAVEIANATWEKWNPHHPRPGSTS